MAGDLPSSATTPAIGGFVSGVADVKFFGLQLYALEAGAGCSHGLLGTNNSLLRVNVFTRLTLGRKLSVVATGLSTVLGTDWHACGNLYALDSMTNAGFPIPQLEGGSGRVVRINRSGPPTTIVTGLDFPSAMAFAPDGALYIPNDGFGPPTGSLLRVDLGQGGCHR